MINKLTIGLRNNKKGEDLLVDFWAILVFVIILVIIFIVFMLTKHQSTLSTTNDFKSTDASYMLQSFLRAKADSKGDETVADVILRDSEAKDFTDTKSLFTRFFQGIESYGGYQLVSITISISDDSKRLETVVIDYTNKGMQLSERYVNENRENPYGEVFMPKKDGSRLRIFLGIQHAMIPYEQK